MSTGRDDRLAMRSAVDPNTTPRKNPAPRVPVTRSPASTSSACRTTCSTGLPMLRCVSTLTPWDRPSFRPPVPAAFVGAHRPRSHCRLIVVGQPTAQILKRRAADGVRQRQRPPLAWASRAARCAACLADAEKSVAAMMARSGFMGQPPAVDRVRYSRSWTRVSSTIRVEGCTYDTASPRQVAG